MTPDDRVQDEIRLDRWVDDPDRVSREEMAAAQNRTLGEALREGLRRRGLSGPEAHQGVSDDAPR